MQASPSSSYNWLVFPSLFIDMNNRYVLIYFWNRVKLPFYSFRKGNSRGNLLIRDNHFGENIISGVARGVIFAKPVKTPWGKLIFPDKKVTHPNE